MMLQAAFTTPADAFREAEVLYQVERYAEAIEIYESIRASGVRTEFSTTTSATPTSSRDGSASPS